MILRPIYVISAGMFRPNVIARPGEAERAKHMKNFKQLVRLRG